MPAGEYWDYQLIQNYIYPQSDVRRRTLCDAS